MRGYRMKRECGMLLPVASLPSRYGIGAFSKEAYEFVDKLVEAGQQYWQILPLGPTGYGDSPYQSFSAFAGNPYFIDLEKLTEDGLLTKQECEAAYYSQMAQNGMMTRNEVRGLENLPPAEGGDELTAQSNLVPLKKLGQVKTTSNPPDGSPVRQ